MALQLLRRYSLVTFFLLGYAITWPAWFLANRGVAWATFPGYFGPAIAAAILIAATQGKTGLETLFTRLRHWQVGIRWYLAAIFFPLLSVLIVIIFQLFAGRAGTLNTKSLSPILPQVILIIIVGSLYGTLVAAGEEIGWRGFALPELLKRHNPLIASLIVGIFLGLWHLPLGWLYSSEGTITDSLLYGLGIDAAAVIYT